MELFEEFYPDNSIRVRAYRKDGLYHGKFMRFAENGDLVESMEYKDGKLDGISRRYRRGVLISKISFKDGLPDGWDVRYNEDGSVLVRTMYSRGRLDYVSILDKSGQECVINVRRHMLMDHQ